MTPISPVPAPQGPNQNPRSTHSYQPVSMNWYLLEAAQKSRILSMASPPVLLFTSCLTPFVELLNGTAQASRNLVNFQFTRSMKSLSSAFWYTIASVPMSIIAVATTPFNKGSWARNSYPESMIPEHARKLANPPTQVIDKDAIQRDVQREEDLKNQVAELRGLLTPKQNKKLDRLLGYEAQFAKALEFIGTRIIELETAADPDKLKDACDEIYQEAINSLWNLLTEQQQKEVTVHCASDDFEAKYGLVCLTIATNYQATSIGFNRHINNTINLIATLAGIDTIPLDSTPDQGFALIKNLAQKLSEAEKTEFEKVKDLPNQIQYLFTKLSATALIKAGEEALIQDNVVNLRKQFAENLELLQQTQANLEKTQKDLDAQKQLFQETEQKLLEVTNNYDVAHEKLKKFEQGLPQETQQLIAIATQELQQQHANALNGLKLDHEKAIERLTKTIEEQEQSIDQARDESLERTNTLKEQKEQIVALERQYDTEIKELKRLHDLETTELTNEKTTQISLLTEDHQRQISEIQTLLTNLQQKHGDTIQSLEFQVAEVKELNKQKEILEKQHREQINELKTEHETAIRELTKDHKSKIDDLKYELNQTIKGRDSQLKALNEEHEQIVNSLKEKENELTQQITALNSQHQNIQQNNEAKFNQLHQEKESIFKANTALEQQLDEQKKAVKESQEQFLKLKNENNAKLTLIETLQKQLEGVKKVTVENPISNNPALPTPVIPSDSTTKTKEEVAELGVAPLQEGSSKPRPTTPPSDEDVNEPAATIILHTPPKLSDVEGFAATIINTAKTAPQVPLQDMTNPSSPLSDLLKQLNELKPEKMGSALSNQWGYKLTPVLQKTAQETIEKLDKNVSEFQNISENWNKILDARTQRQKKNNSAPVIPQANFEEFVSNIRNTQQA